MYGPVRRLVVDNAVQLATSTMSELDQSSPAGRLHRRCLTLPGDDALCVSPRWRMTSFRVDHFAPTRHWLAVAVVFVRLPATDASNTDVAHCSTTPLCRLHYPTEQRLWMLRAGSCDQAYSQSGPLVNVGWKQVTSLVLTEVRSKSFGPGYRAPSLQRTPYFSSSCVVSRAMRVFDVRASSLPLGYLCAKFRFCGDLRCCAGPWRNRVLNHSLIQSPLTPREPKLLLRKLRTPARVIIIKRFTAQENDQNVAVHCGDSKILGGVVPPRIHPSTSNWNVLRDTYFWGSCLRSFIYSGHFQ